MKTKFRKPAILDRKKAAEVFQVAWHNERARLANLLSAVTGMRCGEIQALRFKDLGRDCLYARGSWLENNCMKQPYAVTKRIVNLPYPGLMKNLIEQARRNPWGVFPDSFVFWSESGGDIPINRKCLLFGFRKALKQTGFTETQSKQYQFYGWRHFYRHHMSLKLDNRLLKSLYGDKTGVMIERYYDLPTDKDRAKIMAVGKNTFSGLLFRAEKHYRGHK